MHIPGHVISNPVAVATTLAALAGLSQQKQNFVAELRRVGYDKVAYVTAFIFALQMLNFPIAHGTSGHLIGGVLAASLLGTPLAIFSISVVLAIQAVLFGDGSVTTLGANILNMAMIGAGVGGWIFSKLKYRGLHQEISLLASAWISIVLASLACGLELAISFPSKGYAAINAMVTTHSLIGVSEAVITFALFKLLSKILQGNVRWQRSFSCALFLGLGVALSPWASSLPDGLKHVMSQLQMHSQIPEGMTAIFQDYRVMGISSEMFSTWMAALVGVAITFIMMQGFAKLAHARRSL